MSEVGYIDTHDGERLQYRKVGDGADFAIVPGGFFFGPSLDALAHNRTLVLYDPRNRGRSSTIRERTKISIQNDVRDLETVRAHFGAERFAPIGWSYLGMMVVLYANEHPERVPRLVQIGPAPLNWGKAAAYPPERTCTDDPTDPAERDELARLVSEGFDKAEPREFCRKQWNLLRARLVGNQSNAARLQTDPCDTPNEWPLNLNPHFGALFASIFAIAITSDEIARTVTMPALTIHGTKDRNAPYGAGREWAAILPGARLITINDGGHAVWADDPTIVDDIDLFLSGKWPARAEKLTR